MPGVIVKLTNAPSPRVSISDTGKYMATGMTNRGPVGVVNEAFSLADFTTQADGRVGYGLLMYDAADRYFAEGGGSFLWARVVGPSAVAASVTLNNGSTQTTLVVTANSPGEWANGSTAGLSVAVVAGVGMGTYALNILLNGVIVEQSGDLTTDADAVAWSAGSAWVVVTLSSHTGPPVVAGAANLTGGVTDQVDIVTAQWTAANLLFTDDYGAGTEGCPGITTPAIQETVAAHSETVLGRVCTFDGVNTSSAATLEAAGTTLTGQNGARKSALFVPWGVAQGVGTSVPRTVPYSAVQAGIIARRNASAAIPPVSQPAAGDNGVAESLIGLAQSWDPATREALNSANVNVAILDTDGQIKTYGYRSLANSATDPAWKWFSAAQLIAYIEVEGKAILKSFVLQGIDPGGLIFQRAGGELEAFLTSISSMISNDPTAAVNIGDDVNTEDTIAAGQVNAALTIQPLGVAETVTLNITAEAI